MLCVKGIHPASKIWVSGPHLKNLVHWSEMGAHITEKNGEVFCKCDVIFLGVKPSLLSTAVTDTLNTLPKSVSCKDVVFISMLAGITISSLREVCFAFTFCLKHFRLYMHDLIIILRTVESRHNIDTYRR